MILVRCIGGTDWQSFVDDSLYLVPCIFHLVFVAFMTYFRSVVFSFGLSFVRSFVPLSFAPPFIVPLQLFLWLISFIYPFIFSFIHILFVGVCFFFFATGGGFGCDRQDHVQNGARAGRIRST